MNKEKLEPTLIKASPARAFIVGAIITLIPGLIMGAFCCFFVSKVLESPDSLRVWVVFLLLITVFMILMYWGVNLLRASSHYFLLTPESLNFQYGFFRVSFPWERIRGIKVLFPAVFIVQWNKPMKFWELYLFLMAVGVSFRGLFWPLPFCYRMSIEDLAEQLEGYRLRVLEMQK